MTIEIKHRSTRQVLYASTAPTLRAALEEAVARGMNLAYAHLTNADLMGANLMNANLAHAHLTGARFTAANLEDAVLTGANLTGTNLMRANLTNTNLTTANLTRANLAYVDLTTTRIAHADLTRANLAYVDLTGVDLTGVDLTCVNLTFAHLACIDLTLADLSKIRKDVRRVLDAARAEVLALLDAIRSGRLNGFIYDGAREGLVGTIAKARGTKYERLTGELAPDEMRPAERFTTGVMTGDTPETNPVSRILETWIVEWLADQTNA